MCAGYIRQLTTNHHKLFGNSEKGLFPDGVFGGRGVQEGPKIA